MSENSHPEVIVLKFGSSVLRADTDMQNVVHEIYRWYRAGSRVIAVVSAVADCTDRLLDRAEKFSPMPEPYAAAELLATGERASAALLGIALDCAGVPARVLNPREIGLTVAGPPLDSHLVSVDIGCLRTLFAAVPVLVVPGFFGTDREGRTHCLGRGGSDLTAVFLAQVLGAQARLIKDVDGVYTDDPSATQAQPSRYATLNYEDALRVAGRLIQPKAVRFLSDHKSTAAVAALARGYQSLVHSQATELASSASAQRRLRVALLGLGTVGGGVYQRLLANANHFEVVGVLIRDREKHRWENLPESLLHLNPDQLLNRSPDILVDALPGIEPSHRCVTQALSAGISVVSANKALISEHGAKLQGLASKAGARLLYSASVGGATPILKTIDRIALSRNIATLSAVLNGTCNFLLDTCAGGASLDDAVRLAQREGFAEGDAIEDLSGRDAERKLRIACRHAFGSELESVDVQCFDASVARRAHEAARDGHRLRQVATAARDGEGVRAAIRFRLVGPGDLFFDVGREWNALALSHDTGQPSYVMGRGAGRWPTAEAILGDVLELSRGQ